MLQHSLQDIPLVFLDFETTGLYPRRGDRVCELALQRVVGSTVELRLATLIDPERPLSDQSFLVNQISAADLVGAPKFAELAGTLRAALSDAVLVAHNAPFDLEFLQSELERAGAPQLVVPMLDTLPLARRLFPKRPSHSLGALALALGAQPPSHRAMDDVETLRLVFADLVAQLDTMNIRSLGDVLRYARGFDPGEIEPPPPALIADALRDGQLLRVVYKSRAQAEPTARVIRPIEIVKQRGGLFLRAYCYLRHDLRMFLIDKLSDIEPATELMLD